MYDDHMYCPKCNEHDKQCWCVSLWSKEDGEVWCSCEEEGD